MRFIWIAFAALAQGCQTAPAPAQTAPPADDAPPAQNALPAQDAPRPAPDSPRGVFRPAPVTPQRDSPAPEVQTPEPTDAGSRALIDRARSDLMKRLNVAADQVTFRSFRAVTWPNAALGCPRPGVGYKQVPRDGVLIQLEVSGARYNYHGGGGHEPFLCPNPETGAQPETPNPPPGRSERI